MCSSILSFKMVNVKEAEILLQDTIEDTEQKIHISDSNIRKSNDQLMDSLEEPEQEHCFLQRSKSPQNLRGPPRILSPPMMEIFRCPPTIFQYCFIHLLTWPILPQSSIHFQHFQIWVADKTVYLQTYQTNMYLPVQGDSRFDSYLENIFWWCTSIQKIEIVWRKFWDSITVESSRTTDLN